MKIKKILALILSLSIFLTGCDSSKDSPKDIDASASVDDDIINLLPPEKDSDYAYDFSIYDDMRTFTSEQISIQADFEEFLSSTFIEQMSSNPVTLHFSIENPQNYGIKDVEMSWGDLDFLNNDDVISQYDEILKKLDTFDYEALTYEQQLIYDMLKQDIEAESEALENPFVLSAFSPISGAQSELPVIFSEYEFFDTADIDDYLSLLGSVNTYIDALCEYEMHRKELGYSLAEQSVEAVIEQCEDFINTKPCCLRPVFEEKIKSCSLSDSEIDNYMKKFDTAVSESLIPGYKKIISTLTEINKDNVAKLSLSKYNGGKDYYEYLFKANSGSDKPIDEIYDKMQLLLNKYITSVYNIYAKYPNIEDDIKNFEYPTDDPEEMLLLLEDELTDYFPAAVTDKFTVNYVPKSLESTFTPAFYLIPPIDNLHRNIIYINGSDEYADFDLFPTIAHEGYPGHLYQTTYYYSLQPHYFRSLFNYSGYVEGWAHYIENEYSYKFAGMQEHLCEYAKYNSLFGFAIYCTTDIGINYYGWDYAQTCKYLSTYIGSNDETCAEIYYTLIDDPCVYSRYYVGYLEIMELKEEAMKTLGDNFNIVDFHKFLLDIGPCSFNIISDRMSEWMTRVVE